MCVCLCVCVSFSYRAEWCRDHFLNYKNLRKVQEIRNQLLDIVKTLRMRVSSCGTDWDVVRLVGGVTVAGRSVPVVMQRIKSFSLFTSTGNAFVRPTSTNLLEQRAPESLQTCFSGHLATFIPQVPCTGWDVCNFSALACVLSCHVFCMNMLLQARVARPHTLV